MESTARRGVIRITLLTDFGTADGYVGEVKGVLAALAPSVVVQDVTHEIPPGDVRKGAMALSRYWNSFPPGTVHLAVVDPGVGTPRRGLALEADGRFVVAPDNGLVTGVVRAASGWRAVALPSSGGSVPGPDATFHGRDVFAPAAARLATGGRLEDEGVPVTDPVLLHLPAPRETALGVEGEVVDVDRFGNLVTNIPGSGVGPGRVVEVRGRRVPVVRAYGEVGSGELLALVNSQGWLEVAAREASAASLLQGGTGLPVVLLREA